MEPYKTIIAAGFAALVLSGCATPPPASHACSAEDLLARRQQLVDSLVGIKRRYTAVDHALNFDVSEAGDSAAIQATRERIRTILSLVSERDSILTDYSKWFDSRAAQCGLSDGRGTVLEKNLLSQRQRDESLYAALSVAERESMKYFSQLVDFVVDHPGIYKDASGLPRYADEGLTQQLLQLELRLQQSADSEVRAGNAIDGS